MDLKDTLDKLKLIQNHLLEFVKYEDNIEEHYQNLIQDLSDQNIIKNRYFFELLLLIIVKISNNHAYTNNFFNKIMKILNHYKDEIKSLFTNREMFNIFESNKRILLYLLEEKIVEVDNYIFTKMTNDKYKKKNYDQYFFTELKPFYDSETIERISSQLPKDYDEKRKNGQNDQYITELIRNDLIDEFITYVNKNDYPIKSTVENSIFETNSLLLEREVTLIEYTAFFGSIQIFKYLYLNNVILTPSLWIYSIHGDCHEMIHILEEQKIKPEDETYRKCFIESIKCYNNDYANYFENNYLTESKLSKDEIFKLFNFYYLNEIEPTNETFFYSCKYNYIFIVDALLKTTKIDINAAFKHYYNEDEISKIMQSRGNYYYYDNEILDKKEFIQNGLIAAIENNNTEIAKILLLHNNINVNCESIVSYEKKEEEEEEEVDKFDREDMILKVVIKKPALYIAVENQNIDIIKLLLSHPDINVNSHYTYYNDTNTVNNIQYWNKFNAELDHCEYYHVITTKQKSSLHVAVENNDLEIVKLLLSKPTIDVNDLLSHNVHEYTNIHVLEKEKTALHIAVQKQNIDIIELLLKNPNIDVNTKEISMSYTRSKKRDEYNYDRSTALCMAVKRNNLKIVQLLLQNPNIDVCIKKYHHYELYGWYNDENIKTKETALQLAKFSRYEKKQESEDNSQIIELLSAFHYKEEEEEKDDDD